MKYLSCSNIQNGLRFEYNSIKFCCFKGTNSTEPFYIKKNYYGEKLNWKEIFNFIENVRENQKRG